MKAFRPNLDRSGAVHQMRQDRLAEHQVLPLRKYAAERAEKVRVRVALLGDVLEESVDRLDKVDSKESSFSMSHEDIVKNLV